jgi:hypothetical protein
MTTTDLLGKIMGTPARVKLMRLFLFHPETGFTRDELMTKTKTQATTLRAELSLLEKIGFITKKDVTRSIAKVTKKKTTTVKKRVTVYLLDQGFTLIEPLSVLLLESELIHVPELPTRLKSIGKLKLLVVSGVFLRHDDRPIDLLIVGDKFDMPVLHKTIGILESEIGRELRYALFTTDDFLYRIKMYDKLIRDIFEFPHQKLVNQLGDFL